MEISTHFIEAYFTEEKITSLIIIIIGLVAILLALFFLCIIKYSFFKGMAVPLLLIGLIQLIAGGTVFLRSQKDIIRVEQMITSQTHKIKTEELPRMEKVLKNFTTYKWIEISCIVFSIVLFIAFYNSSQTFWKGLALGLLIQASIIFTVDTLSENRAKNYLQSLKYFDVNRERNK